MENKRVLIITPTALPTISGNAVTAERWRRLLTGRGATVKIIATEGLSIDDLSKQINGFQPHIIHAHHAVKTGGLFLHPLIAHAAKGAPLAISVAGTDVNTGIRNKDRRKTLSSVFRLSGVVMTQSRKMGELLSREFPDHNAKFAYLPKSPLWFGDAPFHLRELAGCSPDDFLFFLPAGIRPVKRNLECLACFEEIHSLKPQIKIVFAGPALDEKYAAAFQKRLDQCRSFASWIGTIPPEFMRSAYESADIVLNTSVAEGLSTTLLEAITAGRPVLASDIPGNRWLITGENGYKPCGLLYNPDLPGDIIKKTLTIIDNLQLVESFKANSIIRTACLPTAEDEANTLVSTYNSLLALSVSRNT